MIVLVVSSDGVLVGTITDGDIRRAMVRGLGLSSLVTEILKKDPCLFVCLYICLSMRT